MAISDQTALLRCMGTRMCMVSHFPRNFSVLSLCYLNCVHNQIRNLSKMVIRMIIITRPICGPQNDAEFTVLSLNYL